MQHQVVLARCCKMCLRCTSRVYSLLVRCDMCQQAVRQALDDYECVCVSVCVCDRKCIP